MIKNGLFNKGISNIIGLLDREFFIVLVNRNVKCVCTTKGTGQANPACPECLGTGHKIKIKRFLGAAQDSTVPSTTRSSTDFIISRNYYILSHFELNKDDIIVDKDEAWSVFQYSEHRSFDGIEIFKKCACVPKKKDTTIFLKNFYKITGR